MSVKIGYLVQQFPPEVGAGSARVMEMALRWRQCGAEVCVITGMPNRPEGRIHAPYRGKLFLKEEVEGVRVLRSWLYASPKHGFVRTVANNTSFMISSALHGIARASGLDVLIASSPPLFPHIAGASVARWRQLPLVLEIRDLWPDYLVGMGTLEEGSLAARSLFGLEKRLLRCSDAVVAVTESFRERIILKGVAAERVVVIPNGVDPAAYYPSADEPPPVPQLERLPGEFIVGYLGNFGAGQRLGTVVQTAALLAEVEPGLRFVLIGDGPDRINVEREARALNLPNLSILGPIPKNRTRAFYNACDVCLVPLAPFGIFQETIPSKIFEVMACGRPVLASLGGEAAKIVEQSGGGVVTSAGCSEGMASGLRRLRAMTDAERVDIGKRGRTFVVERFDRNRLADRYFQILKSVAANNRNSTV
jgi:colanic acid biosynthesis glycosyl transferase WcaI